MQVFMNTMSQGSFFKTIERLFRCVGAFEVRVTESPLGKYGNGPLLIEIQGRGLVPVERPTNVGFITSVLDVTDGDPMPVLSHLEEFQEPTTIAFQQVSNLGIIDANQWFGNWSPMGAVPPDILQPPMGGHRRIEICVRMVDFDDMPEIEFGFEGANSGTMLWSSEMNFEHFYEGKGYKEDSIDHDEARAQSIKLGITVAKANGSTTAAGRDK